MVGFFNAMNKKKQEEAKSIFNKSKSDDLFHEVKAHYDQSWDDLVQPQIAGWKEKESMLIGKNYDAITGQETNSGVYDPRVATIALERVGRVMSQNPTGKPLAMSKDDKGKNMLMNLLMDKWVIPNANSQFSFLIKSRLWDLYSLVYGTMFALVDRCNIGEYSGADFWLLPIRHCRPQPGKFSIKDSDYFGVSTWVSDTWLKKRNKETWNNIDELLALTKDKEGSTPGDKEAEQRTLIEQERQPTTSKSKDFKKIEIYTEYRKDKWITIAPEYNLVLREIENPNDDGELPIVAKYAFPLLDSIYGLGEFERGKSLQFGLNSLWNLYLDGVKMSIFPPIQMVADDVVPSSIKMEPAAKWLLTKPNAKIETFNTSPQGINTFQNTYNYLIGAILNQAGTTDTTVSSSTDNAMGKTPQALKLQAARESTRDSWDRFMMEEAMQEVMKKFVNITASGLDKEVELRLFASEIEDIQKIYPDVVEMLEGDERGLVKVGQKIFKDTKFDYQITKGSTYMADKSLEQENISNLLNFTIQNYDKLEPQFRAKQKTIDLSELYERSLITSGLQDWEKIIKDAPIEQPIAPEVPQMLPQQDMGQGLPPEMAGMPQEVPQAPVQQFNDPDIAAFAQQFLGGGQNA